MLGTNKVVVVVVVAAAVVVVSWLRARNLFRFEQRYTRLPPPIRRVERLCCTELRSTRCGGSWRDAARAEGQTNGHQQVLTACLRTDPTGSTFLVRKGHVIK